MSCRCVPLEHCHGNKSSSFLIWRSLDPAFNEFLFTVVQGHKEQWKWFPSSLLHA